MTKWMRSSLAAFGWNGLFVLTVLTVAIGGFYGGRLWSSPLSVERGSNTEEQELADKNRAPRAKPLDPNARVVAYIHEKEPISREEFGDFLIARFGPERIEFFIKRKLLDMECQAKNIHVTDAEIDAELKHELTHLGQNVTERDFEQQILKQFKKSLFEWKEDVLRVKVQLRKLVEPTITVTDAELLQAFDTKYGPSVECRMIALQKGDPHAFRTHERVRSSEAEFREFARKQYVPTLAATGGKIPNIHRNFPDANVEKEAFSMKEGDVSPLLDMPDGTQIILKCDKQHPKDKSRTFEQEREALAKELHGVKLNSRIPQYFQEIWQNAKPEVLVRKDDPRSNAKKTPASK